MSWGYRVSGLTLCAERPLPYLSGFDRAGDPDVRIAFAAVPPREAPRRVGPFLVHAPDLVDFVLPGRPAIRIAGGRSITVAPEPAVEDGVLQTLLLGPAFAVLLHQRGQPPLHAGAVRVGEGAIAIAGHSGAGKSTTTHALVRRGCGLLCDDQLVVEAESGLAYAGFPAMKLWRSSAAYFGEEVADDSRVQPELDKFHVPAHGAFTPEAAPLHAVFILVPDSSIRQPEIERLGGPQAVAGLGGLAHFAEIAAAMETRPAIFRWAAAVATRVPVYRVRRPDDLGGVERLAERLLVLSARSDVGT